MKDEKLIEILMKSRYDGHKTQDFVAKAMGVSRKTIQHWEQGLSLPNLQQTLEWFNACGVNPVPYLLSYALPNIYPIDFEKEDKVNEAYEKVAQLLRYEDKLAVLYLFCGQHGSSPSSIIQLMLAHLHNPLRDRIPIASNIVTMYQLNKQCDTLIEQHYPMPNVKFLAQAIDNAVQSISAEEQAYTFCHNSAIVREILKKEE